MRIWIEKPRKDSARTEWRYRIKTESDTESAALKSLYPKMSLSGFALETEKKSRAWAEQIKAEVRRRVHDMHMGLAVASEMTWDDAVKDFLKWGKSRGGLHDTGWTDGVIAHKITYLNLWKELLKVEKIAGIKRGPIQEAITDWKSRGLANSTINSRTDAITGLVRWAHEMGYLPSNPLSGLRRLEKIFVKERAAFTNDEIKKIISEANEEDAILYAVASFTGYRESELRSLTVGDVDFMAGIVHCRKTKNKKDATQVIPTALRDRLLSWCLGKSLDTPLLAMSKNHPERRLYTYMRKLGIPKLRNGKPRVFHSLRRTTATALGRSGIRPELAQRHMRHASVAMTRHYMDRETEEIRSAFDAVADQILPLHKSNTPYIDDSDLDPENIEENQIMSRNPSPSAIPSAGQHKTRLTPQKPKKSGGRTKTDDSKGGINYAQATALATRILLGLDSPEVKADAEKLIAKHKL